MDLRNDDGTSTSGQQKSKTPGGSGSSSEFLQKTHDIISECDPSVATWWNEGFIVKDPEEFSARWLPQFFRTNKFESFTRQLKYYGFKKFHKGMEGKSIGFYHEFFQPGRPDLWHKIKRSTNGSKIDRSEIDVDDLKATVQDLKSEVVELRNLVNDLRRISTLQMEMVMRSGFSASAQHSQQAPATSTFNNWNSHHTSSIQTHVSAESFPSHSIHGMPANPTSPTATKIAVHHSSPIPDMSSQQGESMNIDTTALDESSGNTDNVTQKSSQEKVGNQDSNKEEAALALAALSENRK